MCAARAQQKLPANEKIQRFFDRVFDRKNHGERSGRSGSRGTNPSPMNAPGSSSRKENDMSRITRARSSVPRGMREKLEGTKLDQKSSTKSSAVPRNSEQPETNMRRLQAKAMGLQDENTELKHKNEMLRYRCMATDKRCKYLEYKLEKATRASSLPPQLHDRAPKLSVNAQSSNDKVAAVSKPGSSGSRHASAAGSHHGSAVAEVSAPLVPLKRISQTRTSGSSITRRMAPLPVPEAIASANQVQGKGLASKSMETQVKIVRERLAASESHPATTTTSQEKEDSELPEKALKSEFSATTASLYPQQQLALLKQTSVDGDDFPQ